MAALSAAGDGSAAATTTSSSSGSGNPFRDFLEQQQAASTSGLCPTAAAPISIDATLPVRWMKQEKNGAWTPLRRRDSARVEAAFLAWEQQQGEAKGQGENAATTVLIEGGRYEADVPTRTLRAAYWDNDARPLLRASWFSKPATNLPGAGASGAFVPYSEQDAAAIEETYQAALDETIRSLAAGSFRPTSSSTTEGLSASTSASASASSVSASSVSVGSSSKGAGAVLLRKEMPLSDGTNKVVVTIREASASSLSASSSTSTAAANAGGSTSTNKLGLAVLSLSSLDVDVMQQRMAYGIGVLHNRLLRRGLDPAVEPVMAPVGEEEEEDDEFEREPSHLVFMVHGIGEKMWASDTIQGMLSLRASVEVLRGNVMQQQARMMEESSSSSSTPAAASSCKGKEEGEGQQQQEKEDEEEEEEEEERPPVEEGTETTARTSSPPADDEGSKKQKQQQKKKKKKKKKTRVEFVPVEWFHAVRSDEGSLTRKTQRVTLPTVPLFRQLANDVVVDVLLYMNPAYRQKILAAVGEKMNRAYARFKEAHPGFTGKVSVIGHSLGSVILFDLLAHQRGHRDDRIFSPLDASIHYPQLAFPIDLFMTLGSPIGLFLVVRDQELPSTFAFPTVERFYNVFHPYDPVAYRIEPILQPAMSKLEPALVPHHATGTGEKTFVTRVCEQKKVMEGKLGALGSSASAKGRAVLRALSFFAPTPRAAVAAEESGQEQETGVALLAATGGDTGAMAAVITSEQAADGGEMGDDSVAVDAEPRVEALRLNGGRRFDFAIQEGLIESANAYVSAISSHACYFAHPDIAYFLTRLLHRLDENDGNATSATAAAEAPGVVGRV